MADKRASGVGTLPGQIGRCALSERYLVAAESDPEAIRQFYVMGRMYKLHLDDQKISRYAARSDTSYCIRRDVQLRALAGSVSELLL